MIKLPRDRRLVTEPLKRTDSMAMDAHSKLSDLFSHLHYPVEHKFHPNRQRLIAEISGILERDFVGGAKILTQLIEDLKAVDDEQAGDNGGPMAA